MKRENICNVGRSDEPTENYHHSAATVGFYGAL